MQPQKADKTESIVGYVILAIGLVFIILPAILALWMFLGGLQIPQLVPTQASTDQGLVNSLAAFSNVFMIFFLFVVIIWAGSVFSNRGIALIKDAKTTEGKARNAEMSESKQKEQTEKPAA